MSTQYTVEITELSNNQSRQTWESAGSPQEAAQHAHAAARSRGFGHGRLWVRVWDAHLHAPCVANDAALTEYYATGNAHDLTFDQ